jgi:hypothetical protein
VAQASDERNAALSKKREPVFMSSVGAHRGQRQPHRPQRGASDTGTASSQVLTAAQTLSADSVKLKQQVAIFLQSVRAA